MTITKLLARFRRDEKGVTLVEYGIGITLALIVGGTALATLAVQISDSMGYAEDQMCDDATSCTAIAAAAGG